MTSFEITPIDTLFFRDGKPFSMEEDTLATGLFPPPPGVLYGVLRAAYATGQQIDYREIVERTNHLRIIDLRYHFKGSAYFQAPLDLVISDEEESEHWPLAKPLKLRALAKAEIPTVSNHPYDYVLETEGHVKGVAEHYIGWSELSNYLNGEGETYTLHDPALQHFFKEPKVGIGRKGHLRKTEDGKLYRISMNRTVDFSFSIEANVKEGEELSFNNRCGAETKVVGMRRRAAGRSFQLSNTNSRFFKLLITTPAFFRLGYQPDFKALPGFQDFDIEIITAAGGRKIPIGGFDMKKGKPKPLRFAVPGGSVYYCALPKGQSLGDLLEATKTSHSVSDQRGEEGFGLFQLGQLQIDE